MRSFTLVFVASILAAVLAAPAAEPAELDRRSYTCFVNDPDCNTKCAAGSIYIDCSASTCTPMKNSAFGTCKCSCHY
ncbi:hypothetical protein TWF694_001450 [Orbilia ellipsospora]|uniref:Uncharacterized protein n=1 Tax=Orbilia ellipsospora TaxID=2528407 RepID=A0AAV9XT84_9PEZI